MILTRVAPRQFGAYKKGVSVDIEINGKKKRAEFLGAGRFSNVFRVRDDVFIFTHYGDMSKEIVRDCNRYRPKNKHIPSIAQIDAIETRHPWDIRVYQSRYYGPIDRHHPSWKHCKELRRVRASRCNGIRSNDRILDTGRCTDINYCVIDTACVPMSIKEALTELVEASCNYSCNFMFDDFRPSNLGTTKSGTLILLDPLFDAELLDNHYKEVLYENTFQWRR